MKSLRIFFISTLLLGFFNNVIACSYSITGEAEAMTKASNIFVGTITSNELDESTNSWMYVFKVKKVWKGEDKKEITVKALNSRCNILGTKRGQSLLVYAYKKNGMLITSIGNAFGAGLRENKYSVTSEEILDSLSTKPVEDIKNYKNIKAVISKIGNSEFIQQNPPIRSIKGSTYTGVIINKGKKDGIFKGLKMCFSSKGSIPLVVLNVEEKTAFAIHEDLHMNNMNLQGSVKLGLGDIVTSTLSKCPGEYY